MVKRLKRRKNRELQSRRGARRGCAWDFCTGGENHSENFETANYGSDGKVKSVSRDRGARRGAKLTGMRTGGTGIQIGTKVELCGQEDNSEQQSEDTHPVRGSEHLYGKTKLRPEWLRGQGT
jgi:hypothetical protein